MANTSFSSMLSRLGHIFSGLDINNSTVVLGDIQSQGSISISSNTAICSNVIGQTKVSLQPVAKYVARPSLQRQMETQLHDTLESRKDRPKTLVVCGLGGAGKSQLVLHYVQTYQQDYTEIFWIEAGNKTTLERDYTHIWRLLSGGDQSKTNIDNVVRDVKKWFKGKNDKWLLVFDGADDISDELHANYVDLNTFIPDSPCLDIIITTRDQIATQTTNLEPVQVSELDEAEAVDLLLSYSELDEEKKDEAIMIVKELGYFALAITLAGSYIFETPRIKSCIQNFLPEYRRRRTLLARKPRRLIHQYGESVLTTWETSYAAIAEQYPEALGLLRLLTFLSADDIMIEFFASTMAGCSKSAEIWNGETKAANESDDATQNVIDESLSILQRYSLLTWKDKQASYAMHKLVHTWGYDRMSNAEQVKFGHEAILFVHNLILKAQTLPSISNRIVPHIMASYTRLLDWSKSAAKVDENSLILLAFFTTFLYDTEHFNQGLVLCHFRREAWEQKHPDNHLMALSSKQDLSYGLWKEKRLKESEKLDLEIIETQKRVFGPEHSNTLNSKNSLAMTYRDQRRYKEAEVLIAEGIEINKRLLGSEHPDTLFGIESLAMIYWDEGRRKKSKELMMEVTEKRKKALKSGHPDTLRGIDTLATMLLDGQRLNEAEKLTVEAMETRKRELGSEHPDTLTDMNKLAITYRYQGRMKEAEILMKEVLETRERTLGPEHPDTLITLASLAAAYGDQQQWKEMERLETHILEIRKKIFGPDHPSTLDSMTNLATAYNHQKRWKEAEELMVETIEKKKRIFGPEHSDTLSSIFSLAMVYICQERSQEASDLFKHCVGAGFRMLRTVQPTTPRVATKIVISDGVPLRQFDTR